jgi:hypothetical protein
MIWYWKRMASEIGSYFLFKLCVVLMVLVPTICCPDGSVVGYGLPLRSW